MTSVFCCQRAVVMHKLQGYSSDKWGNGCDEFRNFDLTRLDDDK